jgi:hypothetical protein
MFQRGETERPAQPDRSDHIASRVVRTMFKT